MKTYLLTKLSNKLERHFCWFDSCHSCVVIVIRLSRCDIPMKNRDLCRFFMSKVLMVKKSRTDPAGVSPPDPT